MIAVSPVALVGEDEGMSRTNVVRANAAPTRRWFRRRGDRAGSAARPQRLPDLRGLLFLGGLAAIGVGVWLDWVSYEISGPGLSAPWQTRGIDLGAGRVSLGAAAVSTAVGVAGMASVLSQRVAGLLLVGGAMAVVVAVLSFMADVEDKPLETTGAGVTVEASLAAGGPVTLVGAGALTVAGLLFVWDRA